MDMLLHSCRRILKTKTTLICFEVGESNATRDVTSTHHFDFDWSLKKATPGLGDSTFALTTDLIGFDDWTSDLIDERSDLIWPELTN